MRRAEELSLRGGAGSTNALFGLREVAVTSRTLCPDPKKTRRRSVAGKGESMLESVRTDRSGAMGLKRSRNLASSDDAARRAYALGKFLEGKLLRGRQTLPGGRFSILAAGSRRRFALPIS